MEFINISAEEKQKLSFDKLQILDNKNTPTTNVSYPVN